MPLSFEDFLLLTAKPNPRFIGEETEASRAGNTASSVTPLPLTPHNRNGESKVPHQVLLFKALSSVLPPCEHHQGWYLATKHQHSLTHGFWLVLVPIPQCLSCAHCYTFWYQPHL